MSCWYIFQTIIHCHHQYVSSVKSYTTLTLTNKILIALKRPKSSWIAWLRKTGSRTHLFLKLLSPFYKRLSNQILRCSILVPRKTKHFIIFTKKIIKSTLNRLLNILGFIRSLSHLRKCNRLGQTMLREFNKCWNNILKVLNLTPTGSPTLLRKIQWTSLQTLDRWMNPCWNRNPWYKYAYVDLKKHPM